MEGWTPVNSNVLHLLSFYPQGSGTLSVGAVVGGVLGGLVFLALLVFIAICVGVVLYGYKHPTSKIGLFMIEVCVTYTCCTLLHELEGHIP